MNLCVLNSLDLEEASSSAGFYLASLDNVLSRSFLSIAPPWKWSLAAPLFGAPRASTELLMAQVHLLLSFKHMGTLTLHHQDHMILKANRQTGFLNTTHL